MSTTEPTVALERPDVAAFVAAVRTHLTDLPVEEQQELTEGLAADLTEQVAEGADALGDPAAYAAELRLAAGFPAVARRRRFERGVDGLLDDAGDWWREQVARVPGDVGGLLAALRPAWWVLRGWTAFALVLVVTGQDRDVAMLPTPDDNAVVGVLGLLAGVLLSVQVGRGKLWPGRPGRVSARVVLLLANAAAAVLVVAIVAATNVTWGRADMMYGDGYVEPTPGLAVDGEPVTNVYPYDAAGKPLVGVQLLDQNGRPLDIGQPGSEQGVWRSRQQMLTNVFPMPERRIDVDTGEVSGPYRILPPVEVLPPVTIKDFVASIVKQPKVEPAQ